MYFGNDTRALQYYANVILLFVADGESSIIGIAVGISVALAALVIVVIVLFVCGVRVCSKLKNRYWR